MRRLQAWRGLAAVAFSSVTWAAEPAPILAEAGADNEVVLKGVEQETVEFKLTVLNQSKDPMRNVVARLTDFRNAQFGLFAPVIDNGSHQSKPFDLQSFALQELLVRVKLPKPGDYAARFTLVADDKLHSGTVKINRVAPPVPALEIGELQPVLLKVPFFPSLSASETEARTVTIRETAGVKTTLSPPELQSLTYKPKDNVAFAVPGRIVTPDENTVIPAGKSGQIDIAVADIPRAGRYDATIRFTIPGAAPLTKNLSILARQSWYVAAVFITLGVLLAFLLRLYLGVLQPRFALQGRVVLLLQQLHESALEAGNDLAARQVVERVRDALAAKWDTLSGSAKLIGSTDFDIYEAKVPLLQNWLRLRNWLAKGLPAPVRKIATDTLAGAQRVLENPAATAAEVDAQLSKVGALPADIATAAQAAAQDVIGKLKAELQASTDPDVQALQPALDGLLADFAAGTEPLDVTFAKLNAIRRQYAEALSRSLLQQLGKKPPFDMNTSVWSNAQEKAKALLVQVEVAPDADAAIATYLEAVRSWLRPQLSALSTDLAKKAAVATPQTVQFLALKGRVYTLLADVDAGKLDGALTRVSPILDDYKQLLGAANSTMGPDAAAGLNGLTGALKMAPAGAGVDMLRYFGSVQTAQQLSQRGSRAVHRRKERIISFAAIAIILALAVLSGIKALWAEDWTWGGGTAYLIAFLWGAGLSGFTYDGISGLIKRYVS